METSKLTNLQQELLKLFRMELSDADLLEIKQLLALHFAQKASMEMDRLWEAHTWNQDTMDTWLSEHRGDRAAS